jgi:fibronectin type 3 domain-containing protein
MRRMTALLIVPAVLAIVTASAFAAAPYQKRVGVDMGMRNNFVDMLRENYRWQVPDGGGGWTDIAAGDTDSDGWPAKDCRFIADYRPVEEWFGSIDDPEQHREDLSGTYHSSIVGQATITHIEGPFTISNVSYNSGTNTTTFDVTMDPPGPHHGLFIFDFTNTKRTPASPTGSGITDFKMIRPGYPVDTTQTFTDDFVDCLTSADFAYIRFMNWQMTNGNTEWDANGAIFQSWSNRKLVTDASCKTISPLNKKDGASYETICQLCNEVQMDLWLCVPVAADDNYLAQLAQCIYNNLDANLNVYLEYSNEVWNWGFNQYAWNKDMAIQEVAAGADYDYDGSTDEHVWHSRRFAKRTKDIVDAFAAVFGAGEVNARVRGILSGMPPNAWEGWPMHLDDMLDYLNVRHGAPSQYIYGIGHPLYFGGTAAGGGEGTENYTVDQILDDMRATSDAGVPDRQDIINCAASYGIAGGYISYEGGPDNGGGSTTNLANRITANRVARMATEYKHNFDDNFFALGGGMATQFTLYELYQRYGCWGLTDDMSDPDRNYKFQACRDLTGVRSGDTTPPDPPTGLTANAVSDTQIDLDWNDNSEPDFDSYKVYRSEVGGGPYANIATDVVDSAYSDSGLAGSTTYYYVVTAEDTSMNESGQSNEASATTQSDATPPAAPTGLSANGGDGFVNLDWNDNAEGDLDGYNVYRDTSSGGPYSQVNGSLVASSDYTDGTVTNGTTYYYVVTAVDTSSNESGYSNEASATPQVGGDGLTGDYYDNMDFTNLALTRVDATVNFDWGSGSPDPSMGADQFSVRWTGQVQPLYSETYTFKTNSDDGVRLWVDGQSVIDNWTDHAPTIDTGTIALSAGVKYDIQLDFYENGGGAVIQLSWSSASQAEEIIPQSQLYSSVAPTPPPAPQNLAATAGDGYVDLTWDEVTQADNYNVYRSSGGNWYLQSSPTVEYWTDNNVTNGVTYQYYVTAENTAGESGPSNIVEATPQGDTTPPAAPTNLSATAGDGVVDLDWDDNSEPDLDSYSVYRDTSSGGPYGQIASGVATSDYSDTGVTNGTTYYYVVTAVDDASNESGYSNEASATPADTTPPAAPTGLAATPGDGQVSLDWADNSEPDLASYSVYRDTTSGGPYSQIAWGVAASDHVDSAVTNGTTYYYVVTAVDTSSNESGYSNEASATPQGGATTMHVDSIIVEWVSAGGPNRKGQATVVVKDNLGNVVQNATVTGTFTGTLPETQSGTTDATGTAVIQTKGKTRNPGGLTFCVDGVTHATLGYAPGDNVETCDSI